MQNCSFDLEKIPDKLKDCGEEYPGLTTCYAFAIQGFIARTMDCHPQMSISKVNSHSENSSFGSSLPNSNTSSLAQKKIDLLTFISDYILFGRK